jgi:hypothetical protein
MRRSIGIALLVVLMSLLVLPTHLLAQDEYPLVTGIATDDAIEFPSEVPAGLINLTFENNRTEATYSPLIARLNDGVSMDDFLVSLETEDDFAGVFLVTAYGGGEVAPGESLSYITELIPGEYVVIDLCELCDDEEIISFTVVEGDSMEQTPPEADVTLALVDFAFGVPAQIAAGPQVWHIENFGDQWHHAIIFQVDEGTTTLDARNTLMSSEGPPPYMPIWGWHPTGAGTQSWVTIDLEPGTYAVVCFLPDLNGDFSSHLAHGMIQVFVVE